MNQNVRRQLRSEQDRIKRRLARAEGGRAPRDESPELGASRIKYEVSDRTRAIGCGGIGALHMLARKVGLVGALDTQLPILKRRCPYSESDHILNIAYNVLAGGRVLDDIEVRRSDRAFLDALGARTIPDPTTAGDFCRRFDVAQILAMMDVFNAVRVGVWQQQPASFFEARACIDADGSIVETTGECKQGMDVSYKGIWGYHPLAVTLANTGEVLYIVNRGGNRPSQEGAPEYFTRAIALCRSAGWNDILLRGDSAFSQTAHFDRWHDDGVKFVFGFDAYKPMVARAEAVDEGEYSELVRKANEAFEGVARAKQPRVKEQIVKERGYPNMRLEREDVAEFEHQSNKCSRPYRFVALRKTIVEERGQRCLGETHRYFFYVAVIISVINTYDAIVAFHGEGGGFGFGLGNVILVVNVLLLWTYTVSCHSCRHVTGGRLKHFSKHPVRYWVWSQVSKLNTRHMQFAWITLGTLVLTDFYIMLVASNTISDLRFVG